MANEVHHLQMTNGTICDVYYNKTIIVEAIFTPSTASTASSFSISSIHRIDDTTNLTNSEVLDDFKNGIDVIVHINGRYIKCLANDNPQGAAPNIEFIMYYPYCFIACIELSLYSSTRNIYKSSFYTGFWDLKIDDNTFQIIIDGNIVEPSENMYYFTRPNMPARFEVIAVGINNPYIANISFKVNTAYVNIKEFILSGSNIGSIKEHLFVINNYFSATRTIMHYTKTL